MLGNTMRSSSSRSGQSLIDVLIASGVGAILLVGALSVLTPALRGTRDAERSQDGAALARGLQDAVRSLAASDWNNVASLTLGSPYYVQYSGASSTIVAGTENGTGATSSDPTGLIGYWALNESSGGTASDTSSSGFNGTLTGSPTWTTGYAGNGLSFNPVSSPAVNISDNATLRPSQITVAAWLNPSVLDTAWQSALSKTTNGSWTDGWGLASYVGGANKIHFFITNYATNEAEAVLTPNTWSHVVGTYDGTTIKIYVNGSLVDSHAYSGGITSSNGPLQIGDAQGYSWDGKIDEVRIYNRALDASEVGQLYTGLGGSELTTGFSRSFKVESVRRNSSGAFVTSGGYVDSSTLMLTVTYQWPMAQPKTLVTFLSRSSSQSSLAQSDWAGGSGLTTPTNDPGNQYATSTGIDVTSSSSAFIVDVSNAIGGGGGGGDGSISAVPAEHYAWNDSIGWINFHSSGNVDVQSARVEGYANSSAGEISLDCATSPAGNICGSSNYYITNNGLGTLAGYAWNDTYGWISFSCTNHGCASSTYGVVINTSTGVFTGYAWNDLIGWISFNCSDINICGVSDYKVKTAWRANSSYGYLDSATYDTGVTTGAQVNSVSWLGYEPTDTDVRIQIATSNATSGPWNFYGPDGTGSSYYTPASGEVSALYPWIHSAGRYFRYRLTLLTDISQTLTPRIDDVIVRWSP